MKINSNKYALLFSMIVFLCQVGSPDVMAQQDDQQILQIRNASNAALRAYDYDQVLSFLTDDVLTTTGNGTLLSGKESLKEYISQFGGSKMYWIRTTEEINVNTTTGLAWEHGSWKGYDPDQGDQSAVGGKYSAMWTKASGRWLIKSELFVALE